MGSFDIGGGCGTAVLIVFEGILTRGAGAEGATFVRLGRGIAAKFAQKSQVDVEECPAAFLSHSELCWGGVVNGCGKIVDASSYATFDVLTD